MVIIQPALNLQPSCTVSEKTFRVPSVFTGRTVTTKTIFTSQSFKNSRGKAIEKIKERQLKSTKILHFGNEVFVGSASRVFQGLLIWLNSWTFFFSFSFLCSFKGKSGVTRACSSIYISDDLRGQPWHWKWRTKARGEKKWAGNKSGLSAERIRYQGNARGSTYAIKTYVFR